MNSCRSGSTALSPCEKAILAVGRPAGGKAKQKHRLFFKQTNKGIAGGFNLVPDRVEDRRKQGVTKVFDPETENFADDQR